MPHFIVEYSANLEEQQVDIQGLCEAIREQALQTGFFELGAVRVRANCCKHFAVADLNEKNAFIHIVLRMGAGRTLEVKREIGDAVYSCVSDFVETLLSQPYFALSLEIVEIIPQLSWKTNAMHPRLRQA